MIPKRTDANQAAIVQGLRQAGYSVQVLSNVGLGMTDLLVGGIHRPTGERRNWLLEVKTTDGKLNARQRAWHASWRGQKAVVKTLDEALDAVGTIDRARLVREAE